MSMLVYGEEEWRTTVEGAGWWTVHTHDGERTIYSGPSIADARDLAEWYERNHETPTTRRLLP